MTVSDYDKYRHGTLERYARGKCRCDDCRHANTLYNRRLRKRPRIVEIHGSVAAYNRGCHCAICKAAMAAYQRNRKLKERNA